MSKGEKIVLGFLVNACLFSWIAVSHSVVVVLFSLDADHLLQGVLLSSYSPWVILVALLMTIYPTFKLTYDYYGILNRII